MDPITEKLVTKRLRSMGVGVTKPRLLIIDYLDKHHTHPSVDEIYTALQAQHPKLSRTTIYNNVTTLASCGAIKMLSIDPSRINLDGDTHPHAHFHCRECGRIFDLPLQETDPASVTLWAGQEGHDVEEAQVYLRGICKVCRSLEEEETRALMLQAQKLNNPQ